MSNTEFEALTETLKAKGDGIILIIKDNEGLRTYIKSESSMVGMNLLVALHIITRNLWNKVERAVACGLEGDSE